MLYSDILKRVIPFILTFALSLFVVSFFVDITPGFTKKREIRKMRRAERIRILNEYPQLKAENERLRQALGNTQCGPDREFNAADLEIRELDMPPLPPAVPRHAH